MSNPTQRQVYAQVMTPLGTFVYPKLTAPDTKFDADGVYNVKLRLNAEDSAKLIEFYEAQLDLHFAATKAELAEKVKAAIGPKKGPAKKELDDLKLSDRPYKPAYDDDGNETGEYEFNFKMPAQFTYKKGPKAGQVQKMRPDIFDAKGKLMKAPPDIWGGTTGYVAGELRPYYTAKAGCGLSLRLKGVQIIELRSGTGGRDASAYGFGSHEGGYEGSDEAPAADTTDEGEGAPADGNEDF